MNNCGAKKMPKNYPKFYFIQYMFSFIKFIHFISVKKVLQYTYYIVRKNGDLTFLLFRKQRFCVKISFF